MAFKALCPLTPASLLNLLLFISPPAKMPFSLLLKQARLLPTPGPLHVLLLPKTLFPSLCLTNLSNLYLSGPQKPSMTFCTEASLSNSLSRAAHPTIAPAFRVFVTMVGLLISCPIHSSVPKTS